jgi:hypothetical protein
MSDTELKRLKSRKDLTDDDPDENGASCSVSGHWRKQRCCWLMGAEGGSGSEQFAAAGLTRQHESGSSVMREQDEWAGRCAGVVHAGDGRCTKQNGAGVQERLERAEKCKVIGAMMRSWRRSHMALKSGSRSMPHCIELLVCATGPQTAMNL